MLPACLSQSSFSSLDLLHLIMYQSINCPYLSPWPGSFPHPCLCSPGFITVTTKHHFSDLSSAQFFSIHSGVLGHWVTGILPCLNLAKLKKSGMAHKSSTFFLIPSLMCHLKMQSNQCFDFIFTLISFTQIHEERDDSRGVTNAGVIA